MTPRRSNRLGLTYMIGNPVDETPAEIAEGVYLPFTRYKGKTTLGAFEVAITVKIESRQPICESLTITTRDGTPVNAKALRDIPVSELVRSSIDKIGFPFRYEGKKRVKVPTQAAVNKRTVERAKRNPRAEVLPRVVEAYRQALANLDTRDSATQTVADQLHYQRGYVSRLLSEARKMDPPLLGPAKPGRSGEWAGRVTKESS